jgi:hypothetical protein
MRFRTILAAAAVPAALAAVALGTAGQASAATAPQQFTTHFNQHPDTADSALLANIPGATLSSDGGPVWAFDNITVRLTVSPEDPAAHNGDNWRVDVTTTGSFHGFADPVTGLPLVSDGSTKGQISYDVYSAAGPDGAGLPAQQPLPTVDPGQPYSSDQQVITPTHLSDAVQALFPAGTIDWATSGASYLFSYQNGAFVQDQPPGQPYIQAGDVRGH